ncbi:MAG TPA: universal stress protein [Lentimicrobium sp.]|nr:universal stress protein [Lentimicrobium sp.]
METLTEKIVTIARFPNNRALVLQSMLMSEGIECFLSHQNLLQAAVSTGVEIKVRQSDVTKALKLIEKYKTISGEQKEKALKTIKSVRRILVPVDFSNASSRAVEMALHLADVLKAEVRLLHVYFNPVIDVAPFDTSHTYQINLSGYLYEIEQNARKQFASLICEVKSTAAKGKNRVRVTHTLANGIASDEILALSKKYKPGIIVMGSKGIGKLSEGIIGSVTAKVVSKSEIPVLAIPELTRYSSPEKIKNVLYATDFDEYDQIALSRLINLMHPFHATLHCVHISVGMKKSWDKVKMDSIRNFIDNEFGKIPVKYKILLSDTVINGLESYMRDNKIEAIAVTNHSRSILNSIFTQSITKLVMERIDRPLLVFKASEDL